MQQAGKHLVDDGFQRRQTRADDAHIDLERAPGRDFGIEVTRIELGVLDAQVERADTQARGETCTRRETQTLLALFNLSSQGPKVGEVGWTQYTYKTPNAKTIISQCF